MPPPDWCGHILVEHFFPNWFGRHQSTVAVPSMGRCAWVECKADWEHTGDTIRSSLPPRALLSSLLWFLVPTPFDVGLWCGSLSQINPSSTNSLPSQLLPSPFSPYVVLYTDLIYKCVYIYIHTYVGMFVCMYVVYKCVCVYVYMHGYIFIFTTADFISIR